MFISSDSSGRLGGTAPGKPTTIVYPVRRSSLANYCTGIVILLLAGNASLPAFGDGPAAPAPTAIWLGQDGRDLVNPSATMGGNDVQDDHIAVSGLPTDRKIDSAVLTGYGGGQWNYNGGGGTWKIALERAAGSPNADFYFDPGDFDTARRWDLRLNYDDGKSVDVWLEGKKTDPDRRMPNAAMRAVWIGQDGQDRTGPGPGVGPDGFQDVHISISQLSPKIEIRSLVITPAPANGAAPPSLNSRADIAAESTSGTAGTARSNTARGEVSWEFGLNLEGSHWNAELVRHPDDPSKAELFFSPNRNLAGTILNLRLLYMPGPGDSTTVTGGECSAAAPMPAPRPIALPYAAVRSQWLGQGHGEVTGRGDIHAIVRGLPPGRAIASAVMTDPLGGCWVYLAPGAAAPYTPPVGDEFPTPLPLAVRQSARGTDLYFQPYRDEVGAQMTLRLAFKDGGSAFTHFAAGKCDPYLRGAAPAATQVLAKPGDDLNDLANRYGTVRLSPGTYPLNHPLELSHPVTLTGPRAAILQFSQPANDTGTWQTAIQIGASNTTLNGFTIRFVTSIRWKPEDWVNGSAVLGMMAQTKAHPDPGVNIRVTNMDVESSPIPKGVPLEAEPRLMRLIHCTSGVITGNILKGGVTDVMHGPWEIANNDYRGTMPGSFDYSAFACHYTHDYFLHNNRVREFGPSGKNWRFVVLTQRGAGDVVRDNDVSGVGPKDNDTIPNPNAAEIILTEAYRLHFEGRPSFISKLRGILQIPEVMALPVSGGDVVSVLDGPHAGEWVRVAQPLSPTAFLLENSLPEGVHNISISTGFVGDRYERNTIDMRGSSTSGDMILAGDHFGALVRGNHTLGGRSSFAFYATATEFPGFWGWSHAPFLGALIEGNTWEDALEGGAMSVQHSKYTKSDKGRVYMKAALRGNTVKWTPTFLAAYQKAHKGSSPPAITIGDPGGIDSGELLLAAAGNRLQAPAGYQGPGVLKVQSAVVNGTLLENQQITLSRAPVVVSR